MFKPCQKWDTLPIKCLARFLPWCTSAAKAIEAEQEKEAHTGAQWVRQLVLRTVLVCWKKPESHPGRLKTGYLMLFVICEYL